MKIDIHTHIMPDKMPNWVKKFGYGDFIHLEHRNCKACMMKGDKLFPEVEPRCFDATERLKDMEPYRCEQTGAFYDPRVFSIIKQNRMTALKHPGFSMIT